MTPAFAGVFLWQKAIMKTLTAINVLGKCQRCFDLTTTTALFAGRKPAVGLNESRAVPGTFVSHLPNKLAHTHIGNGSRQLAVTSASLSTSLHHARHIQIFHYHQSRSLEIGLGFRHDTAGRLVDSVLSQAGNAVMQTGNLGASLSPVVAAPLVAS